MEINSNARKFSREFGESLKKGGKAEKNWIQKAIKNPGSLRKKAGVKKGEDISKKELNKLSKSPQQNYAETGKPCQDIK